MVQWVGLRLVRAMPPSIEPVAPCQEKLALRSVARHVRVAVAADGVPVRPSGMSLILMKSLAGLPRGAAFRLMSNTASLLTLVADPWYVTHSPGCRARFSSVKSTHGP